jgi:hypothetical protein
MAHVGEDPVAAAFRRRVQDQVAQPGRIAPVQHHAEPAARLAPRANDVAADGRRGLADAHRSQEASVVEVAKMRKRSSNGSERMSCSALKDTQSQRGYPAAAKADLKGTLPIITYTLTDKTVLVR